MAFFCAIRAILSLNGQCVRQFFIVFHKKYFNLHHGLLIASAPVNRFQGGTELPTFADTKLMNMDELRSRLEEAQRKTRSSVELSKRLIDRTVLQLKKSHRLLCAAERSKELLAAWLRVHELSNHWSHEKAKSGLGENQTRSTFGLAV
jgi:hypothetical protein